MSRSALALVFTAACAGTYGLAEGEVRECRKMEVTGSKIAKQDCRTNVEWAKYDAEEAERNAAMLQTNQTGADPASMN
jgi:hypothetical protein